jgi:hypothetical protein
MKLRTVAIALSSFSIILAGCSSPEKRWTEVSSWTRDHSKRTEVYQLDQDAHHLTVYIKSYPQSPHVREARERLSRVIDKRDYLKARGSMVALEQYLARHPDGEYIKDARKSLGELKDKERAVEELARDRRELEQTPQTISLGLEDRERATNLLKRINEFLGKSVQNDHDPSNLSGLMSAGDSVGSNPKPLFTLDEKTGKLTMRLTATKSREVLLQCIGEVRFFETTYQFVVAGETRTTQNEYFIALKTREGRKVMKARNGESSEWVEKLTLKAASRPEAAWLQSDLDSLVKLFPRKEPPSP